MVTRCVVVGTVAANVEAPESRGMGKVMSRLDRRARKVMTEALLLVDVTSLGLVVFQVHGPFRFVVTMIFSLTVPGWSVVGFLKIRDVAWIVSLCVATSLALEMVLGEILLAWWWHLQIFEMLLAGACAAMLVWQLRRDRRAMDASRR
jgi:hypothetical protein